MSTQFYQGYNENTLQGNEFTVDNGTVTYDAANNKASISDATLPTTLECTGLADADGELDLQLFTNLTRIDSINNKITMLYIDGADKLNYLDFSGNYLTNTDDVFNCLNPDVPNGFISISGGNNTPLTSECSENMSKLVMAGWWWYR